MSNELYNVIWNYEMEMYIFSKNFLGESRAELQGNGDASTAAATSWARGHFNPSAQCLIFIATSLLAFFH